MDEARQSREITSGQIAWESCTWPPGPAADPDGYTRITQSIRDGVQIGDTEDRFNRPGCRRFRLRYQHTNMGETVIGKPFVLLPGQARKRFGDLAEPGDADGPVFSASDDEVVVLRQAIKEIPVDVRCVA